MAWNWRIQRAAVEQEILFPYRESYDSYISGLKRKDEPFEVLSERENADGTLTVLMRKRYNPQNAFLWKQDPDEQALKTSEAEHLAEFIASNWHFCPIDENVSVPECTCWGEDAGNCQKCLLKYAEHVKIRN